MFKKHDRVRLIDSEKDLEYGILSMLETKNGHAICGYLNYTRLHLGPWTFMFEELKLAEN